MERIARTVRWLIFASLVSVDDRLHLRHHLLMRNAGLFRLHRLLDLGAEPRVIGFLLLLRRGEFRDDGRELCHAGNISVRRWWGKAGVAGCVGSGKGQVWATLD